MMLIAVALDLAVGWPARIYTIIGHPVTWIGALITMLDRKLNRDGDSFARRKLVGVAAALICIGVVAGLSIVLQGLVSGWFGVVICGVLAWPLVAMRSMYDHVAAVAEPLKQSDLPAARHAVSMIVGRETRDLDEAAIARAALESLAENTSDGIVAPLFWGLLFGLPGIATYKAINTLDSMIGHRTPRFEAFGWASARIDDLVNLPASRLTGLMFAVVSGRPMQAIATMWRDARITARQMQAGQKRLWRQGLKCGSLVRASMRITSLTNAGSMRVPLTLAPAMCNEGLRFMCVR